MTLARDADGERRAEPPARRADGRRPRRRARDRRRRGPDAGLGAGRPGLRPRHRRGTTSRGRPGAHAASWCYATRRLAHASPSTGSRPAMPAGTAARPGRHREGRSPPTAAPDWSPTRSAPACWSASAATSPPPDRAPRGGWQVVVQDLPDDVPQQITLRAGAAVATSSSARRTWTQDGRPRHHLVDPRTGFPAAGPWRSVTVVAPTALRANTATTAAMVKGGEALGLAAQHRPARASGLPRGRPGHPGRLATGGGGMNEALWALGRGTGVVALVVFTLSIVLGIAQPLGSTARRTGPLRPQRGAPHRRAHRRRPDRRARRRRCSSTPTHSSTSSTSWCRSSAATDRCGSVWARVAIDLLAVITVVSLLRNAVGPRVFRAVHWLTYALWPVALLHGARHRHRRGLALDGRRRGARAAAPSPRQLTWRLLPSYAERGRARDREGGGPMTEHARRRPRPAPPGCSARLRTSRSPTSTPPS